MTIYPAIDLLDGKCVRLRQGAFDASTVYSDDPFETAKGFERAGATHLHVVDLSGAKDPKARQAGLIARLISATNLRVQTGGGLRSFEDAAELLRAGADRVVIGSAAVRQPALVLRLLTEFGGPRVTVALDVRVDDRTGEPCVATAGWTEQTAVTVRQALSPFLGAGLTRVLCTDIARDGMMTGPNVELYQRLLREFPGIDFQASGGMSRLEDLVSLKAAGVRSAVVGKAIYEGAIRLEEALKAC